MDGGLLFSLFLFPLVSWGDFWENKREIALSCPEALGFSFSFVFWRASLVAQMVKNLPAMQDTWVGENAWRREWLPTPVFLPGESPWTEEPGGLQSIGSQSTYFNSFWNIFNCFMPPWHTVIPLHQNISFSHLNKLIETLIRKKKRNIDQVIIIMKSHIQCTVYYLFFCIISVKAYFFPTMVENL